MTYQKAFFEKNEDLVKEVEGGYAIEGAITDEQVIDFAQAIVADKLSPGSKISNPQDARKYVRTLIGDYDHEAFGIIWLNAKHEILASEILFEGCISSCNIYPRQVAKMALQHNAKSLFCWHNHPSGTVQESAADKRITETLSNLLRFLDVDLLDHFIVSRSDSLSFAEKGLL